MKREELGNVKRVRFNDFSEYDSEKCSDGGSYGFGLIIVALKMATGKSVTEQQQIWSFALAVVVLATTTTMTKKSIVVVILKQSLLMSC